MQQKLWRETLDVAKTLDVAEKTAPGLLVSAELVDIL